MGCNCGGGCKNPDRRSMANINGNSSSQDFFWDSISIARISCDELLAWLRVGFSIGAAPQRCCGAVRTGAEAVGEFGASCPGGFSFFQVGLRDSSDPQKHP